MKKISVLLTAAALVCALSACGSKPSEAEDTSTLTQQESTAQSVTVDPSYAEPEEVSVLTSGTLNPETIPGKIRGCFYGNGNSLLVLSDSLYLYDTEKDKILANVPVTDQPISVKQYDGGYLVSGIENGSVVSTIYDDLLNEKERLVLSELMSDDFIFGDAVAISKNGKRLAFAGIRGIYLYDLENKLTSVLQAFENAGSDDGIGISMMNHIAFSGDGGDVIYTGLGHSIPIIEKDSYEIDGFAVHGNALMMPQSFTKADGTLLTVDLTTKAEKFFRFNSKQEGKDGVFFSSQGDYAATAVLENGPMIRIYDVCTGELLCEEMIQDVKDEYRFRVPQVMILDDSKSCIVLMGHTISDIDTAIYTFDF